MTLNKAANVMFYLNAFLLSLLEAEPQWLVLPTYYYNYKLYSL